MKLLLPLTEGEDPASIAALPESLLSDFTLSLAKRCLLSPEEELLFQEAEEEETEEYEASEREDGEDSLPLSEKLSESPEEVSEIDLCRGL